MSIRPIDQTSMVNRTQQISANKQAEISKGENISYHNILEREKNTLEAQNRVQDMEQTEDNIIKEDEEKESPYYKKRKREKKEKEQKEEEEFEVNEKIKKEYAGPRGNSVDIRI